MLSIEYLEEGFQAACADAAESVRDGRMTDVQASATVATAFATMAVAAQIQLLRQELSYELRDLRLVAETMMRNQ